MKRTRGFTLIELLVVITLIGVLSSIVLVSLSAAKSRGSDAGVKADLATIQVQATLYYGIGNTFGTATSCSPSSGTSIFYDNNTTVDIPIQNAIASVNKDASGGASGVVCVASPNYFVVGAKLADGKYWCVDNTNTAPHEVTTVTTSNTSCP